MHNMNQMQTQNTSNTNSNGNLRWAKINLLCIWTKLKIYHQSNTGTDYFTNIIMGTY